jgi:hypothetical protein
MSKRTLAVALTFASTLLLVDEPSLVHGRLLHWFIETFILSLTLSRLICRFVTCQLWLLHMIAN